MAKAQTRFIAEVDGTSRVLVSVAENSSGDIHITPSRAEYSFYEDRQFIPTAHQVYTVHRSANWAGNSIHNKVLTNGEPGSRESHLHTLAVSRGLLQPLYVHTFRNLRDATIRGSVRSKDAIISIGNYEPEAFTLHLLLFLTAPHVSINGLQPGNIYSQYLIKFREFNLIAAISYSTLGAIPEGFIRHFSSTYPTIDGVRTGEPLPPSPGLLPDEAKEFAEQIFAGCHGASYVRTIEFFRRGGNNPDREFLDMLDSLFKFGPKPVQPPYKR